MPIEIRDWEFHVFVSRHISKCWADGLSHGTSRLCPGKIATGRIVAAHHGRLQTAGGAEYILIGHSRRGQSSAEISLPLNTIVCEVLANQQIVWCGRTYQLASDGDITPGTAKLVGKFEGSLFTVLDVGE